MDAGGSWTRVQLRALRLAHRGVGRAGVPMHQSSLLAALRALPADVPRGTPMVLGVSGAGTEAARLGVIREVRALGYTGSLRVVPDFYAGLFASEADEVLTLVAGTGSVVALRVGSEIHRGGGWGPMVGDPGSGLALGRLAAAQLARRLDRGEAPAGRWRQVLQDLGGAEGDDRRRLVHVLAEGHRVARLAPALLADAEEDPEVAAQVRASVGALARQAATLVEGRAHRPAVLATGGLLESPWYRALLEEELGAVGLPGLVHLGEEGRFAGLDRLAAGGHQDMATTVAPALTPGLSPTELVDPFSQDLDLMDCGQLVEILLQSGRRAAEACLVEREALAALVELAASCLGRGGRIFYVGAGTSGRLGVLDASECPPTFHVDPDRVQGLLAGGPRAAFEAVEGAEDVAADGAAAVRAAGVGDEDLVVGIAASGGTPWVGGALDAAREAGAATALVTSNPGAPLRPRADLTVAVPTGPEVLRGSTRLGAGTAAKLILNLVTTGAWVRNGKCYGNHMVDLRPTNEKLRQRARRTLRELAPEVDEARAAALLEAAGWRVKTALLMQVQGLEAAAAEAALEEAGGVLRRLIGSPGRSEV